MAEKRKGSIEEDDKDVLSVLCQYFEHLRRTL